MRKISFRIRNFDTEQFLTYDIDNEADLDEELLDFLEDEEPAGLVPVIFEDDDEEFDTFSYDITNKIHLTELSNQEINAEMVLMVMRGLIIALTNMAEYRVPLSYLVLHRNYIYIDADYKVEFICIPLEDMKEEADVRAFLRGFLANLRFDLLENGDYVARLLSFINNPAVFNLHNLLTLVEEIMDERGIEIPDDNDTEIYADYQEVEEKSAVDLVEELDEDDEESEMEEDVPADTTVLKEEVVEEESKEDTDEEAEEEAEAEEEIVEEEIVEEEKTSIEDDAEEMLAKIKKQVMGEDSSKEKEEDEPEEELEVEEEEPEEEVIEEAVEEEKKEDEEEIVEEKKEKKRPSFKTRESTVTGVVIPDELDDFLAEKEREDQEATHEESSLKIKKNIKVSRASIVKNTQDEIKAAEEAAATDVDDEDDDVVSTSILSQTIGSSGILKGSAVPKANPYLVRVNTDERIMITKQTFKIGKASMGVDYTVKGNGAVSRVHAIITSKDDVYYVKDNKSTNHTYVNGKIINDGESELLTHDSKIMLGDEEFVFKLR